TWFPAGCGRQPRGRSPTRGGRSGGHEWRCGQASNGGRPAKRGACRGRAALRPTRPPVKRDPRRPGWLAPTPTVPMHVTARSVLSDALLTTAGSTWAHGFPAHRSWQPPLLRGETYPSGVRLQAAVRVVAQRAGSPRRCSLNTKLVRKGAGYGFEEAHVEPISRRARRLRGRDAFGTRGPACAELRP